MAISFSILGTVYSGISVNRDQHLKEMYFRFLKEKARQLGLNFPNSLFFLREVRKDVVKKLKRQVLSESPYPVNHRSDFLQALLIESVMALEKSVHWYYVYRLNMRAGFRVASTQARYYAEFFSVIGLSRFLGIAITHLQGFGRFQINVKWVDKTLEIIQLQGSRGGHLEQYNALSHCISDFNFIESSVSDTISQGNKFLLNDERVKSVYEFGRQGDPFLLSGPSSGNPNFLGGETGLGITMNAPSEHLQQVHYYEYIHDQYTSDGFYDHGIGEYQRQLIRLLLDLNETSVLGLLLHLRKNIEKLDCIRDYEKVDLLEWLPR